MERVFGKDNIWDGKAEFETVMLQGRKTCRNAIKCIEIWFRKALDFLTMKIKCIMAPNSEICMTHNKANCDTCTRTVSEQFV